MDSRRRKFVVTDHDVEVGRVIDGAVDTYQHEVLVAAIERRGAALPRDGYGTVFGWLREDPEGWLIEVASGDLTPARRALLERWATNANERLTTPPRSSPSGWALEDL